MTNEEIVEEAWQIVNDSFLETGGHRWSPDSWLVCIIVKSLQKFMTLLAHKGVATDLSLILLWCRKRREMYWAPQSSHDQERTISLCECWRAWETPTRVFSLLLM